METSVSIHSVKGMSLYGVRRIVGLPSVLSLEIQVKNFYGVHRYESVFSIRLSAESRRVLLDIMVHFLTV